MIKGFKDFLMRGNVVDLAVAVVIGTAFAKVVESFVTVIMDLVGKLGGTPDFSSFKPGGVAIGGFLTALVGFLVVAAAVYFMVVVPMNLLAERRKSGVEPEPEAPSEEIIVLQEIRDARRLRSPSHRPRPLVGAPGASRVPMGPLPLGYRWCGHFGALGSPSAGRDPSGVGLVRGAGRAVGGRLLVTAEDLGECERAGGIGMPTGALQGAPQEQVGVGLRRRLLDDAQQRRLRTAELSRVEVGTGQHEPQVGRRVQHGLGRHRSRPGRVDLVDQLSQRRRGAEVVTSLEEAQGPGEAQRERGRHGHAPHNAARAAGIPSARTLPPHS